MAHKRGLGAMERKPGGMQRRLRAVPRGVLAVLGLALAAQLALGLARPGARAQAEDLPPPPALPVLRLAALGDPVPLGKLLMLYVQAFDLRADNRLPYQAMDYHRLAQWLARVLELDPAGQYPLHAASHIYAEVPQADKVRVMLDFVYREFARDPARRWPWLAEAAVIAQHRLHDLPLARQYAAAVQASAIGPDVPLWAREMQAFILEDMNELVQARIMIGGYIASGEVKDPGELRWLRGHLQEIETRIGHNAAANGSQKETEKGTAAAQ
jgi:hypothetical protein